MRQRIQLGQREELGPLLVIVSDIVEGLGDSLEVCRRLCFHNQDRDAIHEEHHVGTDIWWSAVREGELVGDVESILAEVVMRYEAEIPLSPFFGDERSL